MSRVVRGTGTRQGKADNDSQNDYGSAGKQKAAAKLEDYVLQKVIHQMQQGDMTLSYIEKPALLACFLERV